MKEMKGVAPAAIAIVIIVVVIAAAAAYLYLRPPEEEKLLREETVYMSGAQYGPAGHCNPIARFDLMNGDELIYESLFWWNRYTGDLEPWLAESYEWTDPCTLEITLHEEAHWRDGTPVTAEDVKYSLEAWDRHGVATEEWDAIESVDAVDEHTVRINLKEDYPYYLLVQSLLIPDFKVFPKERWSALEEEMGEEVITFSNLDGEEMNGSGPYNLYSESEDKIVLRRVEDWWGNDIWGTPAPKWAVHQMFATDELAGRAFKDGDTDWGNLGVLLYEEPRVETYDWVTVWDEVNPDGKIFPLTNCVWLMPNLGSEEHPEIGETWLRQAVAYAIDYDDIMDKAWEGVADRASPSFILEYVSVTEQYVDWDLIEDTYGARYIPHDPDKAIEILEAHCEGSVEEGWTWNEQEIGGWLIDDIEGWADVNIADEIIVSNLEDIGIYAETNFVDWDLYVERMEGVDFDWQNLVMAPLVSANSPHTELANLFTGTPGAWANWMDYTQSPNFETVGELITELGCTPIGSTESISIAHEIQSIVVPELPAIPVAFLIDFGYMSTQYWTGWPTVDNPYQAMTACWYDDAMFPVFMNLEPAE